MTVTIKSEVIGDYYIYIEQDKYSPGYKVGLVRKISDQMYGYPLSERYYPSLEKAKRRYKDLKVEYIRKGE